MTQQSSIAYKEMLSMKNLQWQIVQKIFCNKGLPKSVFKLFAMCHYKSIFYLPRLPVKLTPLTTLV